MSDLYLILLILLRGTWIILKFVKDKNNLLPYNLWAGGEYRNIITNEQTENGWFASTTPLIQLTPSTEWKSNGLKSIKCSSFNKNDYCEYHCYNFSKTKSIYGIIDLYSESSNLVVHLMVICLEDRTKDIIKTIHVSSGEIKNILLTINNSEFDDSYNEVRFRILSLIDNNIFYIDNLQLIQTQ